MKIEKKVEKPELATEAATVKDDHVIVSSAPRGDVSSDWVPKTKLGKEVFEGKITNIKYIFENGIKITEPEIVDLLIPDLKNEIILIGGSTGKGGGVRRTPSRRTSRMHKSGRRYSVSVMTVVGNSNGYVGVGIASGPAGKNNEVINKALAKAKMNLMPIRRGCGSWECKCGGSHSIPVEAMGRSGSVYIKLIPAPKGIGLCVAKELKKIMLLAGITDIWSKSRGQRTTRINLVKALFSAFSKIDSYRMDEETQQNNKVITGRAE